MQNVNFKTLDRDAIYRAAPSVFADKAHSKVSDRYGFINTLDLITAMEKEGFLVTQAGQSKIRDKEGDRKEYTKHLLRFRHVDAPVLVDGVAPEILMFNSHDRSSGFSLEAGLFRFVCSNGLVVCIGEGFGNFRCRHSKGNVQDAIEGVYSVVDTLPAITAELEDMSSIVLDDAEREAFAESAMLLRWDEGKELVTPRQLLAPRRVEDNKKDIFTTYNVIQENLVQGGLRGRTATGRRQRTRAIESINADTKLNKGLYTLAQKMAELKKAA